MEKKYDAEIATLYYKEGILYGKYKEGVFNLAQAKALVADLNREFGEYLPLPMLADISAQKMASKEIREYLATEEVTKNYKAGAIVANSILAKIIGNLFLTFNKQPFPTKIFTDEAAAVAWLQQFK